MSDYQLVPVVSPEDWAFFHAVRQSELFARRPDIVYDANHPDDRTPRHFPLLLKFNGKRIGVARLDLLARGAVAMRLVAIERGEQRKGHGRALMRVFEDLARAKGAIRIFLNAHQSAVGFYERLGFVRENWVDPAAGSLGDDSGAMSKAS